MSNLPQDIITNILLTLPVKSLSKFKCISKSWCSLISDPYFIKKQLHFSTNYRVIMECEDDRKSNIKSFPLCPVFNELSSASIDAIEHNNHPRKGVVRTVEIVGSCNGLVLIIMDKNLIYLWNPTTSDSKRISYPEIKGKKYSGITYGFGYDKSNQDYKVAAIFKSLSFFIDRNKGEMKVYSLKTNSWSAPKSCPYGGRLRDGVFVDDEVALVWVLDDGHSELGKYVSHYTIVAYDLSTETYQKLPQPDLGQYNQVGVLGGNLCFIAQSIGDSYPGQSYRTPGLIKVDLWVMKKYGVGESWTKVITIPYSEDFWDRIYSYIESVLWLSKKSDQVLVTNNGKFFSL